MCLKESIEDVKLNLPKKYYNELPKILNGPLAGFPRIYALAIELVKNTVGGLNRENITHFLESYQSEPSLDNWRALGFSFDVTFKTY